MPFAHCSSSVKQGELAQLEVARFQLRWLHPSQQQLVEGSQNAAPRGRVLWRGMRGMNLSRYFLKHGGCEMSPMSTTDDLAIAVRYARDAQDGCEPTALLFR